MAYNPTLPTSRDRVRFALVDVSDPPAFPGGESGYDTLITEYAGDEAAIYRAAAHVLEGVYAQRAASLSSSGEGLSYLVERVTFYRIIASGARPYPLTTEAGSGSASSTGGEAVLTPVW